MELKRKLRAVISGSFSKFKPEIDRAIDNLRDLGITVLSPDKGWLYIPRTRLYSINDKRFRALPAEVGMTPGQIENNFLEAISNSDFVYVVNPGGYIGETVSLEIGFAMALEIPIFSQEPILQNLDPDPLWKNRVSRIRALPLEEIIASISHEDSVK